MSILNYMYTLINSHYNVLLFLYQEALGEKVFLNLTIFLTFIRFRPSIDDFNTIVCTQYDQNLQNSLETFHTCL